LKIYQKLEVNSTAFNQLVQQKIRLKKWEGGGGFLNVNNICFLCVKCFVYKVI
jgi:hypothetical protein